MGLFSELKRRNVFRTMAAYLVLSWVILQVVSVVLPALQAPEWILSVIVVLLGVGFVFTLVFSWAFALTPEGLRRESSVDVTPEDRAETARKLDLTVITLLVVAIVTAVGLHFVKAPETTAQAERRSVDDSSVAVLPFVNMSGVAENEYFSDGLTETLLHMLAQVDGLKVAARTSSFAFKGQDTDIREIAATLGVANILEGSVQRAGNRVRITAQLIDADDGSHLWSENYDRQLDDIFAIQDEIASAVATRLTSAIMPNDARLANSTKNTQAYDLYLRGLEQKAIYSYGSLAQAEAFLRSSLAIDPGFTDARLALADTLYLQWETGLRDVNTYYAAVKLLDEVIVARPQDAVARAMRLRYPLRNPEETGVDYSYGDIIGELQQLAAMAPNEPAIHEFLANAYLYTGERDKASRAVDAALRVDPLDPDLYGTRYLVHLLAMFDAGAPLPEHLAKARESIERAIEINPGNASLIYRQSSMEWLLGDSRRSFELYLAALEADPNDPELSADLAAHLYKLKATGMGDHYLEMARAIDPNAPIITKAEIARLFHSGDMQAAVERSAEAITRRVRNRQNTFEDAIETYTLGMIILERNAEALAFLDKEYPEYREEHSLQGRPFEMLVRLMRHELLADTLTPGQRRANAGEIYRWVQDERPEALARPFSFSMLRAEVGQNEEVLKTLSHTGVPRFDPMYQMETHLRWPAFAVFREHPDVQEAMRVNEKARLELVAEARDILAPR
ncbi:MAG: hypothetical protein R3270_06010 [Gammaproteobacteria bacterium]|nr:hypothetical protein [Gammaproteobacteria bacterium]